MEDKLREINIGDKSFDVIEPIDDDLFVIRGQVDNRKNVSVRDYLISMVKRLDHYGFDYDGVWESDSLGAWVKAEDVINMLKNDDMLPPFNGKPEDV